MDKERLKVLARSQEHIPEVSNYCDRWCERCPFTGRCLTYSVLAGEGGEGPPPGARDPGNEAFWRSLSDALDTAVELLAEIGAAEGVDLVALAKADVAPSAPDIGDDHPCAQAAQAYFEGVREWFRRLEAAGDDADREPEAMEVILRYQLLIPAKVMRAVAGRRREPSCAEPDDADGSAKVALVAVERSAAAWAVLRAGSPEPSGISELLFRLERLRRELNAAFPRARAFRRPGFDDLDRAFLH